MICKFIKRRFFQKIVCDANIWYGIVNRTIKPKHYQFKNLSIVGQCIEELISTENIFHDLDTVKNIVRTIQKQASTKENWKALEFAYSRINTNHNLPNLTNLEDLESILEIDPDFQSNVVLANKIKSKIESLNKSADDFALGMNDSTSAIRKNLRNKYTTKQIWNLDLKPVAINILVESMRENFPSQSRFNPSLNELKNYELYIYVFEYWIKELTVMKSSKTKTNDIYDLNYLLYIQPGDKYWSKEKKWNRIIKECNMEKYLYSPQE